MMSDVASPLNKILNNIASGLHPEYPKSRSLYEHFVQTRYAELIEPIVLDKWNEISQETPRSRPSTHFCEGVCAEVFGSLSDEQLLDLQGEAEQLWSDAKNSYDTEIRMLYAQSDTIREESVKALPNFLRPILTAIEAMTGLKSIFWAGGKINDGHGLINVTREHRPIDVASEAPLTFPRTQRDLFERTAQEWMYDCSMKFLGECIESSSAPSLRLLSSAATDLFARGHDAHNSSHKAQATSNAGGRANGKRKTQSGRSLGPFNTNGAKKAKLNPTTKSPGPSSTGQPAVPQEVDLGVRTSPPFPSSDVSQDGGPASSLSIENNGGPSHFAGAMSDLNPSPSKMRRSYPDAAGLLTRSKVGVGKVRRSYLDLVTTNISISPIRTLTPTSKRRNSLPARPQKVHAQQEASIATPLPTPTQKKPPVPKSTDHYPSTIRELLPSIPASATWIHRSLYDILKVNLGPQYHTALKLLIEFESLHGFTTKRSKPFSVALRPAEVETWVSTGRGRGGRKIIVTQPEDYAKRWWAWWVTLQPAWRKVDGGKPVTPSDEDMTKVDGESYDWKVAPGSSGFLNVAASLYWWGCAVYMKEAAEKEDWERALKDFIWTMGCVVISTKKMKVAVGLAEENERDEDVRASEGFVDEAGLSTGAGGEGDETDELMYEA